MAKPKAKKRQSPNELSGTEKTKGAGAGKQILHEGSKPLLIIAGLWVGNMAGKAVDKMLPVTPDAANPEKFQWKSIIKPIAQLGAGGTIIYFGRKNDFVKSFGYGFTGSGIINGAKLLKKDLFEGLGETEETTNKPIEAKYYREAKDEMMKLLQDNSFRPALPENTSVATPISAVEMESESEISGLDVQYAEIL